MGLMRKIKLPSLPYLPYCLLPNLLARRAFFILVIGFLTQVRAFLSWLFHSSCLIVRLALAHFFSISSLYRSPRSRKKNGK